MELSIDGRCHSMAKDFEAFVKDLQGSWGILRDCWTFSEIFPRFLGIFQQFHPILGFDWMILSGYWNILKDFDGYWRILKDLEGSWGIVELSPRFSLVFKEFFNSFIPFLDLIEWYFRDIETSQRIFKDLEGFWRILRDLEGLLNILRDFPSFSRNFSTVSSNSWI